MHAPVSPYLTYHPHIHTPDFVPHISHGSWNGRYLSPYIRGREETANLNVPFKCCDNLISTFSGLTIANWVLVHLVNQKFTCHPFLPHNHGNCQCGTLRLLMKSYLGRRTADEQFPCDPPLQIQVHTFMEHSSL